MSPRYIILLAPFVLHLVDLQESSEFLPKNCTEEYRAKVSKESIFYMPERYETKCGFWSWGRCTRYRGKKITKTIYEIKSLKRNICCNGSISFNKTACTSECPEGMYGSECTINCSCPTTGKWSSRCDKMTGKCSCENGYQGGNCDEVCPPGYFGRNCKETCLCHGNSSCDHVDGSCNCTYPGWTGDYCQNKCTNMTFGYNCNDECNCTANETCDPVDGKCTCKAGLTGKDCQTVCTNFTFGPDCNNICNCKRKTSLRCHPVTGECTCSPGWEGRTCSEVCGLFSYGLNCSQNCTCGSDRFCNHIDGTCYSDLCYAPNTINCGHQDNVDFCTQFYDGTYSNLSYEDKDSMELKLQEICTTLDVPQTTMICLAENNCNCSTGFEGQFCSEELFDSGQVSSSNAGSSLTVVAITIALVCAGIVIFVGIFLHRRMESKKSRAKSIVNRAYALNDIQRRDDIIPASTAPRPSDHSRNNGNERRVNEDEYDDLNRSGQHRQSQGRTLNTTENAYSHLNSPSDQTDGTYSHMNSAHDQTDGTYSHTNSPYDQSEGNYSHMNTGDAQAEGSYDYTHRESNTEENSRDNAYSVAQSERSSSFYANFSTGKKQNREASYSSANAEEEHYSNTK